MALYDIEIQDVNCQFLVVIRVFFIRCEMNILLGNNDFV